MADTPTKTPKDNAGANKKDSGSFGDQVTPTSPMSSKPSIPGEDPNAMAGGIGGDILPVSPTDSAPGKTGTESALKQAGGPDIQEGDTGSQKANKTANAAIDKLGSSGGGGEGAAGKMAGGGATSKATEVIDKFDNETPEEKAKREGSTANTALRTGGAVGGEVVGGEVGEEIGKKGGEELAKNDRWKKVLGVAAMPIVLVLTLVSMAVFMILYFIQNPFEAIVAVLTDSKLRDFGLDAAQAVAHDLLPAATQILINTGEVEYHGPNTAIAATPAVIPPGSTLERLSKIDWKKAQYQYLDKSGCGYKLKFTEVVNTEGKVRSIPKSVQNNRTGVTINLDDLVNQPAAAFCIQKQYPIFNMMARQPVTREINTYENTDVHLNYASKKDTEDFKKSKKEVDKYVYDKTLVRITPGKDTTINFEPYKPVLDIIRDAYAQAVKDYNLANPDDQIPYVDGKGDIPAGIDKMYTDMAAGTSPYDMVIKNYINIPTKQSGQSKVVTTGLANTLCPFVMGFLDLGEDPTKEESAQNARAAIESRLGSTERGAIKINTLADTRKADQLSNVESNSTITQNDKWANSTAYQLDVYNKLTGIGQNPEATSTRAYNAKQTTLYDTPAITQLKYGCVFAGSPNGILQDVSGTLLFNGYRSLKDEIVAQSEGVYSSPTDFGLQEIITSFVRTGSVTAVSGLEAGPDNYNRQAAGFRQLMNDYFLRIGGRFLTETEATQIAIESENTRRTEEKDNGIGYRLFAQDNIRSARSIIAQNTISPKTAMSAGTGLFKQLLNPLRSLADIHSSALYFGLGQNNRAFAANITGDKYLKIDTAGIPKQDFDIDMLSNATYIENIKANGTDAEKRKISHWDACFKKKIPTAQYFKTRTKLLTEINNKDLTDSIKDKYPGANAVQWFIFYPEWHRGVIQNANGDISPVRTDDPEGFFNKFNDCKEILQDAKDINSFPVKYRMYTYYNVMLDQLVSLSSDEDNQSIYAKSDTGAPNGGPIGAPDPDADTSGTPCPVEAGITEGEDVQTYGPGKVPANKIHICNVQAANVIDINVSLASQLNKLIKDARAAGINFGGGGFRSFDEQVNLYNAHCNSSGSCSPPTAVPGTSNHEKGLAIDFTVNDNSIDRGSPGFNWLVANAANYGLINLPSEPWHWSVTGG